MNASANAHAAVDFGAAAFVAYAHATAGFVRGGVGVGRGAGAADEGGEAGQCEQDGFHGCCSCMWKVCHRGEGVGLCHVVAGFLTQGGCVNSHRLAVAGLDDGGVSL